MNLKDCHNFSDFRKLDNKKLPSPIFHYIDGAADDEITYNHISNADLGNKNPGSDSILINFKKNF